MIVGIPSIIPSNGLMFGCIRTTYNICIFYQYLSILISTQIPPKKDSGGFPISPRSHLASEVGSDGFLSACRLSHSDVGHSEVPLEPTMPEMTGAAPSAPSAPSAAGCREVATPLRGAAGQRWDLSDRCSQPSFIGEMREIRSMIDVIFMALGI